MNTLRESLYSDLDQFQTGGSEELIAELLCETSPNISVRLSYDKYAKHDGIMIFRGDRYIIEFKYSSYKFSARSTYMTDEAKVKYLAGYNNSILFVYYKYDGLYLTRNFKDYRTGIGGRTDRGLRNDIGKMAFLDLKTFRKWPMSIFDLPFESKIVQKYLPNYVDAFCGFR